MATHITTLKVGTKTYNLSATGKTVFFNASSKTGGFILKGVTYKDNQFILTSTSKVASEYQLGSAIEKSK